MEQHPEAELTVENEALRSRGVELEGTDAARGQTEKALQGLAQIGRGLAGALDLAETAERVVSTVLRLSRVRRSVLFQLDSGAAALVCVAAVGEGDAGGWIGRTLPADLGVEDRPAAKDRPILQAAEVAADPRIALPAWVLERLREEGCGSWASLPLIARGEAVGALVLGDAPGRVFTEDDIRLLHAVADQAIPALENARLYEETRRQLRQTETLLAVGRAVSSTLEVTEVIRRTIREMVRALGADMGGAWLLSPHRDQLVSLAGYHVPNDLLETFSRTPLTLDHPLMGEVTRRGGPIYSSDSQADPIFDHPILRLLPHTSVLVSLMRSKDEIVGGFALVWTRERHRFTPEELRMVEGIAGQAAIAIENAQLLQESKAQQAHLETLLEVTRQLSRIQPLESLLGAIAGACGHLLGSDAVAFRLVEGEDLVLAGTFGDAPREMLTPRLRIGESLGGRVAAAGEPLMVLDLANDPRLIPAHREACRDRGYRALLGVPVKIGDRVAGTLAIWTRREQGFPPGDLAVATAFASQAALALENARLYEEVRSTRDFLRSIAENSADAIITTDVHGRFTYFSPGAEELLGYRAEEVLGRPASELYWSGPEEAWTVMGRVREEGQIRNYETAIRAAGGRRMDVNASFSLLRDASGAVVGTLGVIRDVTEEKRAEEALRDSEERHRLLFESNPHPMWVVDLETLAILAVNEAAVRHYGYSRGEFLALTFTSLRPPEDNPTLLLLDAFSELPPELSSAKVWRHQKKDGTIIDVELISSEILFGGRSARLVLANDVTERKRAEEALRRSEEQYRALSEELERRVEARTRELRSLFNGVPIGLFRTTPDGQILDANPALVRMLGYEDRDALLGTRAIDLYVDPEDRQRWQTLVTSGGELRGFEARLRRPDGSVFWQRVNIRAVRGSDGRVLFYEGAAEEITERKQAEAGLQR